MPDEREGSGSVRGRPRASSCGDVLTASNRGTMGCRGCVYGEEPVSVLGWLTLAISYL